MGAPVQPRSTTTKPSLSVSSPIPTARDKGGGRREHVQEKRALRNHVMQYILHFSNLC
jgi:hypothetical protein